MSRHRELQRVKASPLKRVGAPERAWVLAAALAFTGALAVGMWVHTPSAVAGRDDRDRIRQPPPRFAGQWVSTYGMLTLTDAPGGAPSRVQGSYVHGGGGTVDTTRQNRTLTGRYRDAHNQGEVEFTLRPNSDHLMGRFRVRGTSTWVVWEAFRQGADAGFSEAVGICAGYSTEPATGVWSGRWKTSYGVVNLKQHGRRVHGTYVMSGRRSTVEGIMVGRCLAVQYIERDAAGLAVWVQSADGRSFKGRWRAYGTQRWTPWTGRLR